MTRIQELLAQNMRKSRKKLDLSQMQLAELCCVSTSFIGEIEIGRKFPSAKTLQKIANALKLKPYQLFFEEEQWNTFDKYNVLTDLMEKLKKTTDNNIEEVIKSYL